MLRHLSKVKIEFNPFDHRRVTSALEFLAQCTSRKAKDSNPKCEILVKRRTDDHPPFVAVTYENGREDMMDCATMTAQKMRQTIIEKSEMMETEKLFKDAGLEWPPKIPEEEVALAAAMDQDKNKKKRR
eukprot:TRINITY_DN9899_c0_g1_i1.p1 TRINITY_DN9899_c0_g1~~TRINITY_DN9899_c0_g1_i1.p1  ORF type:complete len:129 (+),score=23.98 TRINITY_DN9899_c0_g1_i1:135-521(+)